MTEQSPPEGWYTTDEHTERFWTGSAWSNATRPRSVSHSPERESPSTSRLAIAAVLAALAIGLVMSIQSASLLTGTSTIWTGAAITVGALIFAFVLKLDRWVKIVAVIVVLIAVFSAVYVENELDQQRQEISNIGN